MPIPWQMQLNMGSTVCKVNRLQAWSYRNSQSKLPWNAVTLKFSNSPRLCVFTENPLVGCGVPASSYHCICCHVDRNYIQRAVILGRYNCTDQTSAKLSAKHTIIYNLLKTDTMSKSHHCNAVKTTTPND